MTDAAPRFPTQDNADCKQYAAAAFVRDRTLRTTLLPKSVYISPRDREVKGLLCMRTKPNDGYPDSV